MDENTNDINDLPNNNANTKKWTGKEIAGIVVFILLISTLLFGFILGLSDCSGNNSNRDSYTTSAENLWNQAKIEVKTRLKYPSTAEFPSSAKADISDLGKNRYKVSSYVKAQNDFGVMITQNFVVIFKYENEKLELESCSLY